MKVKEIYISDVSLNKNQESGLDILKNKLHNLENDIPKSKVIEKKDIKNFNLGNGLNFLGHKVSQSTIVQSLLTFYKANKRFSIIGSVLTIIAIASGISIYLTVNSHNTSPQYILNITGESLVPKLQENIFITSISNLIFPSEPKTSESPINGILFPNDIFTNLIEKRPIAVLIDNEVNARQQSGISQADLVYESLTEGGITRLMSVYWSNEPTVVGPIRSARSYYLDWFGPFDPLFVHDGCAASNISQADSCTLIDAYKVKDVKNFGNWRDTSNGRVAPHNEYVSLTQIWDYAKQNNMANMNFIESWLFKNDAITKERGSRTTIEIRFTSGANSQNYKTTWVYSKENNSYARSINNIPNIDKETNKQIVAKVLIIEDNVINPVNDELGHINIKTIGEGSAKILQDGKINNVKWKKTGRTARTKYFDNKGQEFVFNRGLIWITSLPTDTGDFKIVEQ